MVAERWKSYEQERDQEDATESSLAHVKEYKKKLKESEKMKKILKKQLKKKKEVKEKIDEMIALKEAEQKNYWEDINDLQSCYLDAVMMLFNLDDKTLNEKNKKVKMKVDERRKVVKEIEPIEKDVFDLEYNANKTRYMKTTIHLKQIEKGLNKALLDTFHSVPEEDHINSDLMTVPLTSLFVDEEPHYTVDTIKEKLDALKT